MKPFHWNWDGLKSFCFASIFSFLHAVKIRPGIKKINVEWATVVFCIQKQHAFGPNSLKWAKWKRWCEIILAFANVWGSALSHGRKHLPFRPHFEFIHITKYFLIKILSFSLVTLCSHYLMLSHLTNCILPCICWIVFTSMADYVWFPRLLMLTVLFFFLRFITKMPLCTMMFGTHKQWLCLNQMFGCFLVRSHFPRKEEKNRK